MMQNSIAIALLSLTVSIAPLSRVLAQVAPDQTLPNPTLVTPNAGQSIINGGTQRGGNLFHSFQEFSIPTGTSALFNNSLAVQNIFARVTGNQGSTIDGTIAANGSASLYLINPNGIIFGRNAQLNLGGSFLASTARAVNFGETSFSAEANASQPLLLTSSAPLGLNFSNSGPIQIEGSGHNQRTTSIGNAFISQVVVTGQGESISGLRVQPNKTLALIGGDVTFNGGLVTAPSGQIEVGSVKSGNAGFIFNPSGFRVDYTEVSRFGTVSLLQQSAIDATGDRFSNIRVQADAINLDDASLIVIGNTGNGTVGNIELNASRQIRMNGLTALNRQDLLPLNEKINRSVLSVTTTGPGANIFLNSPEIRLSNSAYITTLTLGSGRSGNIEANTGLLDIRSISLFESAGLPSGFTTATYDLGKGGNISIRANQLRLSDSGSIYTTAFGLGQAGNIVINSDSALIEGGNPRIALRAPITPDGKITAALTFIPTLISSTSTTQAPTGNIFLQTRALTIANGGQVVTSSLGTGRAGDVSINASESVVLDGTVQFSRAGLNALLTPLGRATLLSFNISPDQVSIDRPSPSSIGSAAGFGNSFTSGINNLTTIPNSESGNVIINSPSVTVNEAQITVQNAGIGSAGSLTVNADRLEVNRDGVINASTFNGSGGNIFLNSKQLFLRNSSEISTNSGGFGNGGNININTDIAAVLEQSGITANANRGFGGRINLSTIGLLRSQDSTISASSNQGQSFNGTVDINQIQTNPVETAPEVNPPNVEPRVAVACAGQGGSPSSFVISGKGGTATPTDLSGQRGWIDPASRSNSRQSPQSEELVEAQGAIALPNGDVAFVVNPAQAIANRAVLPPCQTP